MSTEQSTQFLALLDTLYAAAMEPSRWEVFAQQLAAALGAKSALIRLLDSAASKCSYSAPFNFDPEYLGLYAQHYISIDPILEHLKETPNNRIYIAEEQLDYRHLCNTEYYNDYVAPQGNYHLIGGLAGDLQNQALFVSAQREKKYPPFSQEDKALLQSLVPHLQRSLLIWSRMEGMGLQAALMDKVLDRMSLGVIMLDPLGRVAHTNTFAMSLLEQDQRLGVTKGRLYAQTHADSTRLKRFLDQALRAKSVGDHRYCDAMLIRGVHDWADPLYLMAAIQPVPDEQPAVIFDHSSLILLVGPLSQQGTAREDILRVLFGLSGTEAKLAMTLANGEALSTYCDDRQISKHTARTQLKSIFMKMGVNSQVQLVAKIARGPWFNPEN